MNASRIYTRIRYAALGLAVGAALVWAVSTPKHVAGPDDHWGDLVQQDARPVGATSTPLDVREKCRIAAFGVYPWSPRGAEKGSSWESATRSALMSMGLPSEAASLAILRIRAGKADEAIGMGNTHGIGASSGAMYLPLFDTTYRVGERYTVCKDTTTQFANGDRQEFAVLYRVPDASGRMWHVGEFLACGNVTVFHPAPKGWAPPIAPPARAHGAPLPGHTQGQGGPFGHPLPEAKKVPEPASLALVAVGLIGLIALGRRKGKGE